MGPSWGHSAPLAAFWITVGRFLCVWDRSGLDFEVFWERLGSPWALFFEIFQRIWTDAGLFFELAPNTQKPRKNIISFFYDFRISCVLRTKQKNNEKSLPEPVGQSFPQIWRLNPVLKLVGLGYKESGTLFCASWLALGRFWVVLGSSWAALGKLLGPTWPLLGTSRLVWAATWKDFGPQDPPGPSF